MSLNELKLFGSIETNQIRFFSGNIKSKLSPPSYIDICEPFLVTKPGKEAFDIIYWSPGQIKQGYVVFLKQFYEDL